MRRPRVLHVTTSDQRRGAERVAYELSEQLTARGWDSDVVALAHRAPGGLDIPILGERARSPATLWALRRLARGYDVVVAHGSSTLDATAVGLWGSGVPVVYVNIGDPTYWLTSRAKRWRVRWALGRCARVVAIADPALHVLTDWLGVAPERVTVIRNSRDGQHFRPVDERRRHDARRQLGLEADQPVVLVLGSLTREKRVDVALEAVAASSDQQVLIVGEGPLRADLEGIAARRLPGRARFLGSVADPRDVLAASDVLLLTSDTEGVPGVVVEAGLCGLPSVATNVGFVSDVVVDGVTGVLVPRRAPAATAAGLRLALHDAALLGAAAREHCIRRHGVEVVIRAWERMLQDVAPPRG